jgi:hypothetical protein
MNKKIYLIWILLLVQPASADVQVDSNVFFIINNATINFSSDKNVTFINIASTSIDFTGSAFTVIPNNSINLTIFTWNTSGDYLKNWTESSTSPNTTTYHTIGDFPLNTVIQINKNGTSYHQEIPNYGGFVSLNYVGGYSVVYFDTLVLPLSVLYASTSCTQYLNVGTVGFSLIGILFIIMGGGIAISYINSKDHNNINDTLKFTVIIIISVVVGAIGISIINGTVNAIGC